MNKKIITYGSVCSGIEVAHIALKPLGFEPLWFSENADFPSKLLRYHYPDISNYGDMMGIADKIRNNEIPSPMLLCGGTPCNSFSTLGKQLGLDDERGMLSLEFCNIANAIDDVRLSNNEGQCLILWENVEGILKDKGNAFGIFLYNLTNNDSTLNVKRWSSCGIVKGKKRTAVWRVLDAVNFGLPQKRKRVFVVASSNPNYNLLDMLLEIGNYVINKSKSKKNYESITKDNTHIEVFSDVANCLFAAYGVKYNGNNTANSGTLFVAENGKLRRFTPIECERLMGIPDNYTLIPSSRGDIQRYKSLGNAWAVNVIKWIGERIYNNYSSNIIDFLNFKKNGIIQINDFMEFGNGMFINGSPSPYNSYSVHIFDILQNNVNDKYFLTDAVCKGILRRSQERKLKMNKRVASLMKSAVNRSKTSEKDNDDILVRIGYNIKNMRKLNHIQQKEITTRIGISEKYLIEIEKGKVNVSILILEKIAKTLGVDIKELMK